jgi:predicted Ser/Thr protein kinase
MKDNPVEGVRAGLERERQRFVGARSVLSFDQYLDLYAAAPRRYGRDAARWLRDLFDHYGTREVVRPYGRFTRWNLFDLPWEDEVGQRDALIGQEPQQAEVYRALANFALLGAVNRLVLLHGPNGSAKSTFAASVMRAMEDYSHTDEGALYQFNWVFPRGRGTDNAKIGFGGGGVVAREDGPAPGDTYAHLDEREIDAKVLCELRDHPLLLLPREVRQDLLRDTFAGGDRDAEGPPQFLWRGGLSHKSQQVFEALFTAYRGDLRRVYAHVQVERWYVSRRYRTGAVTLGPQMAVDAKERQVTASRSLSSLPPSLQNTALFEPFGELVDAAGGLLEYSDLLKRPLEAWKYLLLMIETGEVALSTSNVVPNLVMIGSSNEGHLEAFREHPEYASFRGRLELVRAPYLIDWTLEKEIYDRQVAPGVGRPVAPHATEMAALYAVLSRLRKPSPADFAKPLAGIVGELNPLEKADLLALGKVPPRYVEDQARELRAGIEAVYRETERQANYEGRTGASPREIRGLILDAAQVPEYKVLSPFAVLDGLAELSARVGEFEWLRQETAAGGYQDPKWFMKALRARLLDTLEDELRSATGFADEARYDEVFERYVLHVSAWTKGEKIENRVSRKEEPADETMMKEIERMLGFGGSHEEFRRNLISRVAAWAIDHPGQALPTKGLFPQHIAKLRDVFFQEHRKQVVAVAGDLSVILSEGEGSLEPDALARARSTLAVLKARFGYDDDSARDAVVALLKERFAPPR